jgi:putative nucleotidyltransferase with HDIG domain
MIAKQLAQDMGGNHDQAFVCGLLHDLGWIVMLEMLAKYDLDKAKRDELIQEHHETLGALVAKKWNFSDEIQSVIRYHHYPEKAQNHQQLVQTIYLADQLAKNEASFPDELLSTLSAQKENWAIPFTDHLEELDREIDSILSLH